MKQIVTKGKGAPRKPLTKAQQELVASHVPYAMNLGKKYARLGRLKGVPMEDLQQEACYGLCIAAQHFDATKDAEFQTYAHYWCMKFIMKAIYNETLDTLRGTSTGSGQAIDVEDIDATDDDDEPAFAQERALKVEAMLGVLNEQEKMVVCMVYGIETSAHSFKEVAQEMNLQTARIHQIYEQSLNKMEFYQ